MRATRTSCRSALRDTPLRPVIASVGDMGPRVPVWDIAKRFRDAADLSLHDGAGARSGAHARQEPGLPDPRRRAIIVTGRTLNDVVRLSAYIPRNGRAIMDATPFGKIKNISAGETAARLAIDPESNAMRRGWEYWARQAGCGELLAD